MFCPVSETEPHSVQKSRKNKKQKKRSEQKLAKRKYAQNPCVSSAMSAWAENFTVAATWQLKHQLAYWKAKAISLQYENDMLHEVIQRNLIGVPTTSKRNSTVSESSQNVAVQSDSQADFETQENDTDHTESESENDENQNENEGENFEVSEEFIQFLTANAKYKEDAKRERELLKAKFQEESEAQGSQESVEERIKRKQELYGDKYQKIVALEMYQMCNLKNESDKLRPTYWPNIPFNLNS